MPLITIMGSVWRSRERAAPSSRNSISSITTCEGGELGGGTGGHLLVEVDELLVWQLEWLYGLEHSVPVAVVDVGREGVLGVHRVQRDRRLLLQGRRLRVFVFVAL